MKTDKDRTSVGKKTSPLLLNRRRALLMSDLSSIIY